MYKAKVILNGINDKNEKRKRGDEERHQRVEKPCVKINEYVDFMCVFIL